MPRPRRILFVARSTTGHSLAGGMERSYEDIAAALLDAGAEVALLTTHGIKEHYLPEYSRVWQLAGGRSGRYSLAWWFGSYFHKESWREWQPDVIFSVSSAAGAIVMRRELRKKMIAQSHGTALAEVRSSLTTLGLREILKVPLNLVRILREIPCYRNFSQVVAIGEAVWAQLTSSPINLPPETVVTISNGVDGQLWAFDPKARQSLRMKLGIPMEARVGVFAARLHSQKGADVAVRALELLANSTNAQLIICGNGPERRALEAIALNGAVQDRVHFLGALAPAEMSRALSASDVFIFPSRRREGLPLNLLEALANGLPLVTVRNANVPSELSAHATITDGTVHSIANAWKTLPLVSNRESRLSPQFSKTASMAAYMRLLKVDAPRSEKGLPC